MKTQPVRLRRRSNTHAFRARGCSRIFIYFFFFSPVTPRNPFVRDVPLARHAAVTLSRIRSRAKYYVRARVSFSKRALFVLLMNKRTRERSIVGVQTSDDADTGIVHIAFWVLVGAGTRSLVGFAENAWQNVSGLGYQTIRKRVLTPRNTPCVHHRVVEYLPFAVLMFRIITLRVRLIPKKTLNRWTSADVRFVDKITRVNTFFVVRFRRLRQPFSYLSPPEEIIKSYAVNVTGTIDVYTFACSKIHRRDRAKDVCVAVGLEISARSAKTRHKTETTFLTRYGGSSRLTQVR